MKLRGFAAPASAGLAALTIVPALLAAVPARAEDAASLAAKFGAREAITDMSLSPGGLRIAIVSPAAPRGNAVLVADLVKGGPAKPIAAATGEGEAISNCAWPTDERLVCRFVKRDKGLGEVVGYTRMISMKPDGSDMKLLTERESSRALGVAYYGGGVIDWFGGQPGEVLMMRAYVPESTNGTRIAERREGIGVERVDVASLRRSAVEQPVKDAIAFISDGHGTVRVMGRNPVSGSGYDKTFVDYLYRKPGSRDWNTLGRVTINPLGTTTGFDPQAVDPDLNAVYGFDAAQGFKALYRIKLDGSNARELVLAKPGIDVDGLVQIGRSGRVVGASFASEYRYVEFFDPELKALSAALAQALPGHPQVSFLDSTADEGKLLMFVNSDTDPGVYYLYDKATHKLEELLPIRPQLAGRKLAEMKPVSYPARDGTMIPGYLTLPPGSDGKNLPAIVMPHGGPSARDEWGFDWLVQYFAARGFAVLQPNFRGSAGFGEQWFEKNGFQSWQTAVGDVDDGGRWLEASGIAAPGKLAIVGWSYGGYAALQSGVLDPGLFKAIVAVAPVTDLALLRQSRLQYTDYKLVDAMIGNGPHVAAGSPAAHADAFKAPVLLFHGDWDTNVDIDQSERMADRLRGAGKPVELVKFPGLTHSLDDAAVRARLLAGSDAFIRKSLALPEN